VARITPKPTSAAVVPRLVLTNEKRSSATLINLLERASAATTKTGARHTLYLLSCYFAPLALEAVSAAISTAVTAAGGSIAKAIVAVDAGDWIQNQRKAETLARQVAKAARLKAKDVEFLPIRFPNQLLHAKAYAAITVRSPKTGFVAITSGNITHQGLGLITGANRELAIFATEPAALVSFEGIMRDLSKHQVTEAEALKNDQYLCALALFGSGVFYHRWTGALGAEARFSLTLTSKGRRKRKEDAFPGYKPDSNSISRDPLGIEAILKKKVAKPFPISFWRRFSVDTIFGYWTPEPIAKLIDERLKGDIKPYVKAISDGTKTSILDKKCEELRKDAQRFGAEGLVVQNESIVEVWRERVERFRSNTELIHLRIFPYTRVPDLLNAEARKDILKAANILAVQLEQKSKLMQTKKIVSEFLNGQMSIDELYDEWYHLQDAAKKSLRSKSR
jgi:hypothetical protein